LLPALLQVYNENWEEKEEKEEVKSLQLCKVEAKKVMVAEEMGAIKKNRIALHQDNQEDILKTLQELAKVYPLQSYRCKGFNSIERLCFQKRPGCGLLTRGNLGK
jgi:hypothetical protein